MTTHEKGHKTGGRRNGAGRKPRQGWVKVGYSLQSSTIALLNAYVERTGRLKSEILNIALLQYLAAWPAQDNVKPADNP
jgi:hypothetical protein